MEFIEQVKGLKIVTITKPRTYLQWTNTEEGRDKLDCYERVECGYVRWENKYGKAISIISGDSMFDVLEEMYKKALLEKENNCFEEQVEVRALYNTKSLEPYKDWTKVSRFLGLTLMGVEMREIK